MIEKHELIRWNNKFSCGIKLIDDQHRKLTSFINEMSEHESGKEIQEHEYFNRVIQEAFIYIKPHFVTEEKIMLITRFKGFEEHKKEHENFTRSVIENIRDYKAGRMDTVLFLTGFMRDWMLSHFEHFDIKYFDYFKNFWEDKEKDAMPFSINYIQNI